MVYNIYNCIVDKRRTIEAYRAKRLRELKAMQNAAAAGSGAGDEDGVQTGKLGQTGIEIRRHSPGLGAGEDGTNRAQVRPWRGGPRLSPVTFFLSTKQN